MPAGDTARPAGKFRRPSAWPTRAGFRTAARRWPSSTSAGDHLSAAQVIEGDRHPLETVVAHRRLDKVADDANDANSVIVNHNASASMIRVTMAPTRKQAEATSAAQWRPDPGDQRQRKTYVACRMATTNGDADLSTPRRANVRVSASAWPPWIEGRRLLVKGGRWPPDEVLALPTSRPAVAALPANTVQLEDRDRAEAEQQRGRPDRGFDPDAEGPGPPSCRAHLDHLGIHVRTTTRSTTARRTTPSGIATMLEVARGFKEAARPAQALGQCCWRSPPRRRA